MLLDLLPDLFDENEQSLKLLAPGLQDFGGKTVFYGEIVTVSCFEDNTRVKELAAQPGEHRVLVIDGGGSLARALVGDMTAQSALLNHWAGVVVNGAVRGVGGLHVMSMGVRALGVSPRRATQNGEGEINTPVDFLGVRMQTGDWLYADANGIAVSSEKLLDI